MTLEIELDTFKKELPTLLLRNAGRFALVKGDKVHSVWDTQADAIQAGYHTFGNMPFLAKQIEENSMPVYIGCRPVGIKDVP
jgi:hypothetical protein